MGEVTYTGNVPISMPCAAEAIAEGKVYKDNGSRQMTIITAKGDVAQGVAAYSSLTDGSAKTLTAGDSMPFYLVGSGAIVEVASGNTETWSFGALVYLHDSVDGVVTTSTSSSTCIGTYWGTDGLVTSAAGELIIVKLDRAPGATA